MFTEEILTGKLHFLCSVPSDLVSFISDLFVHYYDRKRFHQTKNWNLRNTQIYSNIKIIDDLCFLM